MPNSKRSLCIQSAMSRGLSQQDAAQLVDFIRDKKINGDPAAAAAAVDGAIKRELARTAAAARRTKLNAVKRKEISVLVDGMVKESKGKMSEVDALMALLSGSERRVGHSRDSAFSMYQGASRRWGDTLVDGLEKLGVLNLARKHDKSLSDNVIREMREPGSTGDITARKTAELLSDLTENIRVTLNQEGAGIGKLENWCPQSHDEGKIMKAGMKEWIDFIHPLIDWNRTMPEASPEEIAKTLQNIYYNIVTGTPHQAWRPNVENPRGPWDPNAAAPHGSGAGKGKEGSGSASPDGANAKPADTGGASGAGSELSAGADGTGGASGAGKGGKSGGGSSPFARGRNIASSFEHSRVLHFKDAESAVAYNEKFGRGTVFDSVLWHIQSAAKKYGVMKVFGTDAAYNIQSELTRAANRAKEEGRDASPYLKAWDVDGQGKVARLYKEAAGEVGTPQNITLARIGATLRAVTSMAKLGAATLSSFTDIATHYAAARHAGAGLFQALHEGFNMKFACLQSESQKRLGRQLGVFVQAYMGEMYRGFDAADSVPGTVSRLLVRFFKLSGLTGWTEAHKAGYAFFMANELAHAALNGAAPDFAVVLRNHGLEKYLPLFKHMTREVDGKHYVIPEEAWNVPDAELAAVALPAELRETTAAKEARGDFRKQSEELTLKRKGDENYARDKAKEAEDARIRAEERTKTNLEMAGKAWAKKELSIQRAQDKAQKAYDRAAQRIADAKQKANERIVHAEVVADQTIKKAEERALAISQTAENKAKQAKAYADKLEAYAQKNPTDKRRARADLAKAKADAKKAETDAVLQKQTAEADAKRIKAEATKKAEFAKQETVKWQKELIELAEADKKRAEADLRSAKEQMRAVKEAKARQEQAYKNLVTQLKRAEEEAQRKVKATEAAAAKPAPTEAELRQAYAEARDAEMRKAREHLHTEVMAFYADETGYAVLEPDARAMAVMRQGTRAGTPMGEMLRLAMQFKAFPVTFWQRWITGSHWQKAASQPVGGMTGFDWRNRFGNDVPGLIGFMTASLGLGYLAMTAKDLSKGRNFRDPQKASTWVAALLQSGGLGLMGDFFLGTADRFGGGGASFALGPFPSEFFNTVPLVTGMAARGEFKDAAEVGAKFLMNNMSAASIPLAQAAMKRTGAPAALLNLASTAMLSANMWYTRAAFDYALGFHIREMLNPGSLRRMEQKMLRDNNQTYIIKPSDVIKMGGGFRMN